MANNNNNNNDKPAEDRIEEKEGQGHISESADDYVYSEESSKPSPKLN